MNTNIGYRKLIPALLLMIPVLFSIPAQAQHYDESANHHRYINRHTHESPFMGDFPAPWEMADNGKQHQKYGHKRFDELSAEQKERIKKRRETFKALPPEEREQIHKARKKFHKMPPEKREKLKAKWRNMSPEEKDRAYKKKFKSRKKNKHKD